MPGYELPALHWSDTQPLPLELGGELSSYSLAYETWGELSPDRENVVVILHALSGSSHAFSSRWDSQPGWWEGLVAEGSPIHPERSFIICANLLGGCYGSTGPSSVDPRTGRRYGATFPQLTTVDMIQALRRLLVALGCNKPLTLMGGSLGGMLALEWAVRWPDEVKNTIALVAPGKSSPQAIAFRSVQRDAILADPDWNQGECYEGRFPQRGLALARKIGMITYRSAEEFDERFARAERDRRAHFLEGRFEIQSYLDYQGRKFCDRFDPNTYLYFSRAMDLYDLSRGTGAREAALREVQARVLLLAVDSDLLVRSAEALEVHEALLGAGKISRFELLHSIHGHDAFLIELDQIRAHLRSFLQPHTPPRRCEATPGAWPAK